MSEADPTKPYAGKRVAVKAKKKFNFILWGSVSLVVAMLVGLGVYTWDYTAGDYLAKRQATTEASRVKDGFSGTTVVDPKAFDAGEGFAILRIPRLGKHWEQPILKGVDSKDLGFGLGWNPKTEFFGEEGNTVIAGHRITHGSPLSGFPSLRRGDLLTVETATHIYTYRSLMDGRDLKVSYREHWVQTDHPHSGAIENDDTHLLTLYTCSELFSTSLRSVVFFELASTDVKP